MMKCKSDMTNKQVLTIYNLEIWNLEIWLHQMTRKLRRDFRSNIQFEPLDMTQIDTKHLSKLQRKSLLTIILQFCFIFWYCSAKYTPTAD